MPRHGCATQARSASAVSGFGGAVRSDRRPRLQEVLDEQRNVLAPLGERGEAQARRRAAGSRGPRGNARRAPAASRSWLVAAISRTSTRIGWLPPTRSNSFSWSARRSFACVSSGMSPTSSRKSVPPSAASNFPSRRAIAPVNAPFSCPKSSLSTSSRESAAQFTLTSGFARRGLLVVERVRDELLAGAALAAHQHGDVGVGDLVDGLEDALHRGASPDDLAGERALHLLEQAAVIALEPRVLHHAAHQHAQLVVVEGLRQIVGGAVLHRLHGDLLGAVGGDHDDGRIRIDAPRVLEHLHAVDVLHREVGDHHVEASRLDARAAPLRRSRPCRPRSLPWREGSAARAAWPSRRRR